MEQRPYPIDIGGRDLALGIAGVSAASSGTVPVPKTRFDFERRLVAVGGETPP
jgi:hypothetical protein